VNANFNITWILPVDANYTYFVRLHFCEIFYTAISERVFNVYINNQSALPNYDILVVTQPNTPLYVDFIVSMFRGGNRMWVQIGTSNYATNGKDAILNGLEVFKINGTAGSLAGPNPSVTAGAPSPPSGAVTSKSKTSMGTIIGAAVGGVAAFLLLSGLIFYCCYRRAKSRGSKAASTWLPLPLHGGSTDHSKVSTTSLGGKSGKSGAGS